MVCFFEIVSLFLSVVFGSVQDLHLIFQNVPILIFSFFLPELKPVLRCRPGLLWPRSTDHRLEPMAVDFLVPGAVLKRVVGGGRTLAAGDPSARGPRTDAAGCLAA